MKKLIIVIFVITLADSIYSQLIKEKSENDFSLGFGLNMTNYSNIKPMESFLHTYSYRPFNINYNFFFAYHYSKRSTIRLDFFENRIKYNVSYDWPNPEINPPVITNSKLDFYNCRLSYQWNYISKEKLNVFVKTGITTSGLLTRSESVTSYIDNSARNFAYNSFKISFEPHIGTGIQYILKENQAILLDLNYRVIHKGYDSYMKNYPRSLELSFSWVIVTNWRCLFKRESWNPLPNCE
jgi:hypothetical protein